jgi:hypothetical protein
MNFSLRSTGQGSQFSDKKDLFSFTQIYASNYSELIYDTAKVKSVCDA